MAADCFFAKHCAAECPDFLQKSQTAGRYGVFAVPYPAEGLGRGGRGAGAGRVEASAARSGMGEYSAPLDSVIP